LAECRAERARQRERLLWCSGQRLGAFDAPLRARELESAYTEMWRQYANGMAPCSFDVASATPSS
jgi:predicted O-linked N-acetylglucosamine transferase (SPINDLY family)